MTITVPKNLIKAAFMFASKDDARYILNTVQFLKHRTGVIITACDGRRIITIKSSDTLMSGADQVIIPRFRLPKRKPGVPSHLDSTEITSEKVRGRNVYSCEDVVMPVVEGVYPNWKQVFSGLKPKPIHESAVNPEYLVAFGAAAKLIDGEPHVHLQTNDGGQILVKGTRESSQCSWRGLFIPLGGMSECQDVPEWILEA